MAIINDADRDLMYQGFAEGASNEELLRELDNKCSIKTVSYYRSKWNKEHGMTVPDEVDVTEDDIPTEAEDAQPTQEPQTEAEDAQPTQEPQTEVDTDTKTELIATFLSFAKAQGMTNISITADNGEGKSCALRLAD